MNATEFAQLRSFADVVERTERQERQAAEQASDITRTARAAIRAIPAPGERETMAVIACLIDVLTHTGWSHTQAAIDAIESLDSAFHVLEVAVERAGV